MSFNVEASNPNDVIQKNVTITSTTGSPINFDVVGSALTSTGGAQWLKVTPLSNTTPVTLAISVDTSSLTPGQYQGSVNIAATDSSGASLKIPVTLNFSASPLVDLNPSGLTFTYSVGGPNPSDQFVTPTTTTAGLPYTVSVKTDNGGTWLTTGAGALTPVPLDVAVNPAGLQPGTYTGTVTFNLPGVANNPQTLNVALNVTSNPTLTSNPNAATGVAFNYQIGQPAPAVQTVSVDSTVGALGFSLSANQTTTSNGVNWLLVGTPSSGSTPATFLIGVDPTGMNPGQYTGTLTLSAAGTNPISIPVTLNVSNVAIPLLTVLPQSLTFTRQGQTITAPQTVTVGTTGASVSYVLSGSVTTPAGGSWLLVSSPSGPASSGSPSSFFVGVTPGGLPAGQFSGTITVTPTNGAPAVVIPITLISQP